jgi:3-hydroxybutyryl-CoA dehydrogenase
MSPSLIEDWKTRYVEAKSLSEFAECDFVIESVIEDLNVKRAVFSQLESVLRDDAILASNTSALPITLLQQSRKVPGRMIGMHWCEPCHITKFMEVIRGDATSDRTVDLTLALAEGAGKEPTLVKRDIEGFVVNRLCYAMYREAFYLLEQGVSDIEMIDRAFRNVVGMWAEIAGPFRWMDLTGLPAYAAVMKRLFPTLSNATDVPERIQKLADDGARGVTNGRGFYNYTPEEAETWNKKLVDHVWAMREFSEKHP